MINNLRHTMSLLAMPKHPLYIMITNQQVTVNGQCSSVVPATSARDREVSIM